MIDNSKQNTENIISTQKFPYREMMGCLVYLTKRSRQCGNVKNIKTKMSRLKTSNSRDVLPPWALKTDENVQKFAKLVHSNRCLAI